MRLPALSPLEGALPGLCADPRQVYATDTLVPVLLPGNKKTKTGGCGRTFVTTVTPGQSWRRQWFAYSPDRKRHPPAEPSRWLQRCSAGGMRTPGSTNCTANGQITEAACWAHAQQDSCAEWQAGTMEEEWNGMEGRTRRTWNGRNGMEETMEQGKGWTKGRTWKNGSGWNNNGMEMVWMERSQDSRIGIT